MTQVPTKLKHRKTFEVRWHDLRQLWEVWHGWKRINNYVENSASELKKDAITKGKNAARRHWIITHQPTELIIKNMDGTIGKGKGSRTTYGEDPIASAG